MFHVVCEIRWELMLRKIRLEAARARYSFYFPRVHEVKLHNLQRAMRSVFFIVLLFFG